jgi:hypothetical protein
MYFPASSITAGDSFESRGSIAASKKKWREAMLAAIIHPFAATGPNGPQLYEKRRGRVKGWVKRRKKDVDAKDGSISFRVISKSETRLR